MPKRSFPLSRVYRLLEPGSVVLVTTAGQEPPEHHDHVMEYHARIRTAPGGVRAQQPQLLF
jgi:hypothetical protein